MRYISTSFSTRMIGDGVKSVKEQKLSDEEGSLLASDWIGSGGVIINCPFESTAKILSAKLGVEIEPNRAMITVTPGDELLQFVLLKRPPEGTVLSEEELENWPSAWVHLTFEAASIETEQPSLLYIANAFTPAMLADDANGFTIEDIDEETAIAILQAIPYESSIGHEATAALLSELTGMNIPANRVTIKAHPGEAVLVLEIALPRGTLIEDPEELKAYPRKWKLVEIV